MPICLPMCHMKFLVPVSHFTWLFIPFKFHLHPPIYCIKPSIFLSTTLHTRKKVFQISLQMSIKSAFNGPIMLPLLLYVAAALVVVVAAVVAARMAMVAWVMVLVLLTFIGNRRRVLVRQRRRITAEVGSNLIRVMITERKGALTVACAAIVSLLAMAGFVESVSLSQV